MTSACSRRSWNWWHLCLSRAVSQGASLRCCLWVLVWTSSIWLLSLPVPHCFQLDPIGAWPAQSPTAVPKREQFTVLPKSNQSETSKCILHQFVPGLLLLLWLSAKIISNQFSICFQCWYCQLICSLQRPDVPHIVSYRSSFSTCFLA